MTPSGALQTRFYQADKSFHEKAAPDHVLCLQAGPSSLALAVFDPRKERFVVLGDWDTGHPGRAPFADGGAETFGWFLGEILREVPLLSESFQEVKISWEGSCSTLVPEEFYQADERETYLAIQARLGDQDIVRASRVPGYGIWDVFQVPGSVVATLESSFGHISLCHVSAPMAEGLASVRMEDPGTEQVMLNIRHQWFDLAITKDNHLVHYNLFPWQEPADVAYYLVYTLEQFRFDISRIPVFMTGRIAASDELFRLLYRYVTHLSLYPTPPGNLYADLPGQAPYHSWFTVLNLLRCGS